MNDISVSLGAIESLKKVFCMCCEIEPRRQLDMKDFRGYGLSKACFRTRKKRNSSVGSHPRGLKQINFELKETIFQLLYY